MGVFTTLPERVVYSLFGIPPVLLEFSPPSEVRSESRRTWTGSDVHDVFAPVESHLSLEICKLDPGLSQGTSAVTPRVSFDRGRPPLLTVVAEKIRFEQKIG